MRGLVEIFGVDNVLTQGDVFNAALRDWRGRYQGKAMAMLTPRTTAQVAQIVEYARQHQCKIIPQGGNTGMVGGATPDGASNNIIVNFGKMNQIIECNASGFSMVVESGCTLAQVQDYAAKQDRLFPLMLTPRDSVQIGGAVATNAGGLNVVKYGMMRNLVLGIEAVLADGSIWNNLYQLTKNNAGYDLKQLLIGSEGTLGLVTKVALKLFPLPKQKLTAILALDSFKNCLAALASAQSEFGQQLSAFEYIGKNAWDVVHQYDKNLIKAIKGNHAHFILLELESLATDPLFNTRFASIAKNWAGVMELAVAGDVADAEQYWKIRKTIPMAEKQLAISVKHDISIPPQAWEEFLNTAPKKIQDRFPESSIICVGHLGDGNLHFNIALPGLTQGNMGDVEPAINDLVYEEVIRLRGSISAEHGIGQVKGKYLQKFSAPNHYDLMKKIKQTLDPDNILNPGKIF